MEAEFVKKNYLTPANLLNHLPAQLKEEKGGGDSSTCALLYLWQPGLFFLNGVSPPKL